MKICGIICEYNPFHNGHQYQIECVKNKYGIDRVVCAMSGNFTQNSSISLFDKYERASLIENVDLVVNIPTAFAINNAEVFAIASVLALKECNITHLCFGAEDADINLLNDIAEYLLDETNFNERLKYYLNLGYRYSRALMESIKEDNLTYYEILSKPNNLLGIEYLKAIKRLNLKVEIICVERVNNFNNNKILNGFASATHIRKLLSNNEDISMFVPEKINQNLLKNYDYSLNANYKRFLFNSLYFINKQKVKFNYLVTEGIENRIIDSLQKSKNYEEFLSYCVSKRFDESKINKIILNILLDVKKSTIKKLYSVKKLPFVKVLAFKKTVFEFLNKKNNLIFRKNDIKKIKNNYFTNNLILVENNSNTIYNMLNPKSMLNSCDMFNISKKI